MGIPTEANESELVRAAAAGDRSSFDALAGHHAPRLLAIAFRMLGDRSDAEDAVQNAFASAWLALPRFDLNRPFSPWLTTITINKCRDAARSGRFKRFFRSTTEFDAMVLADDQPDQQRQVAGAQLLAQVKQEISRLPSRLKEPFVLVVLEGQSQAEAAQSLGISEKAVETRIYRARKKLKDKVATE